MQQSVFKLLTGCANSYYSTLLNATKPLRHKQQSLLVLRSSNLFIFLYWNLAAYFRPIGQRRRVKDAKCLWQFCQLLIVNFISSFLSLLSPWTCTLRHKFTDFFIHNNFHYKYFISVCVVSCQDLPRLYFKGSWSHS